MKSIKKEDLDEQQIKCLKFVEKFYETFMKIGCELNLDRNTCYCILTQLIVCDYMNRMNKEDVLKYFSNLIDLVEKDLEI